LAQLARRDLPVLLELRERLVLWDLPVLLELREQLVLQAPAVQLDSKVLLAHKDPKETPVQLALRELRA